MESSPENPASITGAVAIEGVPKLVHRAASHLARNVSQGAGIFLLVKIISPMAIVAADRASLLFKFSLMFIA